MGNTIWLALSVCAQKARTQYTYIPCVCCLWPLCNLFHNCFHVFVIQADKAVLCSGGAEKSRRYPCIFEAECSCENQLASWSSVTQQQLYVRVNTILQRGRGGGGEATALILFWSQFYASVTEAEGEGMREISVCLPQGLDKYAKKPIKTCFMHDFFSTQI